jgi:hypothetical protein
MYFSLINSFPNPFACKLQNSFCNPKQIKFHLFNSYKVLIRKKKKFKKNKKIILSSFKYIYIYIYIFFFLKKKSLNKISKLKCYLARFYFFFLMFFLLVNFVRKLWILNCIDYVRVYPVQRVPTDQPARPKTVGLEGPMDQPTSHSKTKERYITFRFVTCISQDFNSEPGNSCSTYYLIILTWQ